jgi:Protein of unknown function (DUF2380)
MATTIRPRSQPAAASLRIRAIQSKPRPPSLANIRENGVRAVIVTCVAWGVAAFLMVAVGARSTAAQNDTVKAVALLNVRFLNDNAALEPTTGAERARLASIESLFKAKLEASGRYKFLSIPADAAAKIAAGPEVGACGGCDFEYGKQLGADYTAWIVVHGGRRGRKIDVRP